MAFSPLAPVLILSLQEVSKKLFHILDNVNRVYERYKKDDGLDPELEHQFLLTPTWEEKSRRSNLLDEISAILKESKFKGQELQLVLESLKAWSKFPQDDGRDAMTRCHLWEDQKRIKQGS